MDLDTLIALLPPHVGAYLLATLYVVWELVGAASHLSAALKRWVLPRLSNGRWLETLSAFVGVLDWIAANTARLEQVKEVAELKAKLQRRDLRVANLSAQLIHQRQLFFGQTAPDNDNGTTHVDPVMEYDEKTGAFVPKGAK